MEIAQYQELIKNIGELFQQAKVQVVRHINHTLVLTYWNIGKHIVEFEQQGNIAAPYGEKLLPRLAKDLSLLYGKGFSRSNIIYMRLFYVKYQNSQTLSDQLTWSHYVELLTISDDLARSFYIYPIKKSCKNKSIKF